MYKFSMFFRKFILAFICLIACLKIDAQWIPPNPTVPEASIDKRSLEISNNLYNGKINVGIPIYNYNFEGVNFPIALNYSGGNGIRPDELPSWVGSGWNLMAGGFVHRTVKGKPDEALDIKTIIYDYPYDPFHPLLYPPDALKTEIIGDYSYFTNLGKLADPNWNTPAFASDQSPVRINLPYVHPGNDGVILKEYNLDPYYDLAPDEFTFSFGDVSGKFYKNHLNKWIVAANNGNKYTVDIETSELEVLNQIVTVGGQNFKKYYVTPRVIKYITLTSEDGVKYYFGSTNTSASLGNQLFDFSHASVTVNPFEGGPPEYPYSTWLNGFDGPTYTEIVPHTWHLSKIKNLKTGSEITLSYKREGFQLSATSQAYKTIYGIQVVFENTNAYGISGDPFVPGFLSPNSEIATSVWTLTDINFPNGITINFDSKKSTQLGTDHILNGQNFCTFGIYPDVMYVLGAGTATLLQLDKINIKNNSATVKEFDFKYLLSPSQRLQLSSFSESANGVLNNKHIFNYKNNVPLPQEYGTRKKDHWGYYNNNDFVTLYQPSSTYYTYNDLLAYSDTRNSNSNYSDAEILTQITYPTKGYVKFEYNSHDYSKILSKTDYTIINASGNAVPAGGVRVNKISYFSEANHLEYEKIYTYQIPGTGNSSGVLSQPIPPYVVNTGSGSNSSWRFQASGFLPIYSEGNNVTYTYVTEKQIGQGEINYEYQNYDNGYNDLPAINKALTPEISPFAFSNKGFKRGQIKSVIFKNESGVTVKETNNKYLDAEDESVRDELRSVFLDNYTRRGSALFASVSNRIYGDFPIENKETEYNQSGSISTKANIIYDLRGNVKEQVTLNSKGETIKKMIKYCYEYGNESGTTGTDLISQGLNNLIQKHCSNYPVEEIVVKEDANGNRYVISGTLYTYKSTDAFADKIFKFQTLTPLLYSNFVQSYVSGVSFLKDPNYPSQPEASYDYYDQRGNLLQRTLKSGIVESTIWGYSNTHPVATITGADYNTALSFVSSTASQNIIQSPAGDQQLSDELNKIRIGLANTKAQITTFTYSPIIGVTRKTDTNNFTTYFQYDAFGRLSIIRDNDNNVIKTYEYNYKN